MHDFVLGYIDYDVDCVAVGIWLQYLLLYESGRYDGILDKEIWFQKTYLWSILWKWGIVEYHKEYVKIEWKKSNIEIKENAMK